MVPDGKTIVTDQTQGEQRGRFAVDTTTGAIRPLMLSGKKMFRSPVWLPDGSGVLVGYSSNASADRVQIGFVV